MPFPHVVAISLHYLNDDLATITMQSPMNKLIFEISDLTAKSLQIVEFSECCEFFDVRALGQ